MIILSIMTDCSKAVKTMDYSIQLKKMHELRFGKNALKLIMDCLNYRYQFVQLNYKQSGYLLVTHRVPEGSILRSVLFNIHILDVSGHTSGTCFQYVDDTILFLKRHSFAIETGYKFWLQYCIFYKLFYLFLANLMRFSSWKCLDFAYEARDGRCNQLS